MDYLAASRDQLRACHQFKINDFVASHNPENFHLDTYKSALKFSHKLACQFWLSDSLSWILIFSLLIYARRKPKPKSILLLFLYMRCPILVSAVLISLSAQSIPIAIFICDEVINARSRVPFKGSINMIYLLFLLIKIPAFQRMQMQS